MKHPVFQFRSTNLKKFEYPTPKVYCGKAAWRWWLSGGVPYSFIEQAGFRKIIKPITNGLVLDKTFNVPNLKTNIGEAAAEIRENQARLIWEDNLTKDRRRHSEYNVNFRNQRPGDSRWEN